ncbi:hypothetical protein D3C86_317770 [compost metagenome]
MAPLRYTWFALGLGLVFFVFVGLPPAIAQPASVEEPLVKPSPAKLELPGVGFGRGHWSVGLGIFAWPDKLYLRNLHLQADMDLLPGTRAHAVIRSNREFNTLASFEPFLDEGYLEGFGALNWGGKLSGNLKLGRTRYLRFPYPDNIAIFDQVPGVYDLRGHGTSAYSGYEGALLTLDYAHGTGLGWHFVTLSGRTVEHFGRYHGELGPFVLEGRAGELQIRPEPLGRSAPGYNLFAGARWQGFQAGVLYERLTGQPIYTGVMVGFTSNWLTQFAGNVGIDYARSPQGAAMHLTPLKGTFGLAREAPQGAELVGEVEAERIRTYWQNSQIRNFYEHRIASWGETTAPDLIAVIEEEPWYLQAEALVSPNNSFQSWDDLVQWEKQRQGPAQISQKVRYKFYRRGPSN